MQVLNDYFVQKKVHNEEGFCSCSYARRHVYDGPRLIKISLLTLRVGHSEHGSFILFNIKSYLRIANLKFKMVLYLFQSSVSDGQKK